MKGKIVVTKPGGIMYDKKLAFINNTPFVSCIFKINNTLIDNAEDLGVVMSLYNCLNIAKIIQKQQEVFGIITEMNQIVV